MPINHFTRVTNKLLNKCNKASLMVTIKTIRKLNGSFGLKDLVRKQPYTYIVITRKLRQGYI